MKELLTMWLNQVFVETTFRTGNVRAEKSGGLELVQMGKVRIGLV